MGEEVIVGEEACGGVEGGAGEGVEVGFVEGVGGGVFELGGED